MTLNQLELEEDLIKELQHNCQIISVDEQVVLAETGKFMKVIPLVLDGLIRVFRNDYQVDREILLYYIHDGQTCMMSLVASFANKESQVHAITERKSELLLIPTAMVRDWQIKYSKWNKFIINTFLDRYTELLNTINDLSFKHIDERIYNYLIRYHHLQGDNRVKLTHQKLANELGTTRVVVSRILKDFENKGHIRLMRGEIQLKELLNK
jgi:CRP/FNR family transcriptional regulator